jgi:argininosuccinate synthase
MTTHQKIVLAFSGGLDTSVILPWLKEHQVAEEIIAVCVDVGLGCDVETMEQKAMTLGASKFVMVNAQAEFVSEYIWPSLQAGAVYENEYLLGTAMARPVIAQKLVEVALKEGATAICHGATGKGNDQVRFELAIQALAPHMAIIAPWRIWELDSREAEIAYLEERGFQLPFSPEKSYSVDQNLWHISHEGLELEDPSQGADWSKVLQLTVPPQQAPDMAETVTIGFENGVPVQVNGQALDPVSLITTLNYIGGNHGVGITDMVENRIIGIKSRGIYENPAGAILHAAHHQLEKLCLDKETYKFKQQVSIRFAELVYNGEWFTPLREALQAFVTTSQQGVTGTVKLTLYKGNILPAGTVSPTALYHQSLSSFATGELFNHKDAEGFITLLGLPLKVRAMMQLPQHGQPHSIQPAILAS